MAWQRWLHIFVIVTVTSVLCEKVRFDNYSLYRILPENDNERNILEKLRTTDRDLDFWNEPLSHASYVLVLSSPDKQAELENHLNANGIDFTITIPNIQENIDKESVQRYVRNGQRNMTWSAYYDMDSINDWLDDLVAEHSNVASIVIGGRSYEGRDIKGIRISHGAGRRAVFIEGGIHSREWIAPATVNYILNELLNSNDAWVQAAARDYDWYIFPVVNPDGYAFTHSSIRMWRKNRRPIGDWVGVDLNRNWNTNWLEYGSTLEQWWDDYAGPGPFSEPETRTLSAYLRTIGDQIDLYLSFHSFTQLLLIPFGNTTEPLSNYNDAVNIGRRAMGALSARYRTRYTTGNVAETIYRATGSSLDWAKEHLNIPLAYCYELRDNGTFGFVLPPDQIRPTGEETMDSIIELIHQAERFGYMNSSSYLKASIVMTVFWVFAFLV